MDQQMQDDASDVVSEDDDENVYNFLRAAEDGDLEKLKYYIENGVDVNAVNDDDCCALAFVVAYYDDDPRYHECLKYLLSIEDIETNIEFDEPFDSDYGRVAGIPLHIAAATGNLTVIKLLLEKSPGELDWISCSAQYTPLHQTVLNKQLDAFKLLIEYGADQTETTEDSRGGIEGLTVRELIEELAEESSDRVYAQMLMFLFKRNIDLEEDIYDMLYNIAQCVDEEGAPGLCEEFFQLYQNKKIPVDTYIYQGKNILQLSCQEGWDYIFNHLIENAQTLSVDFALKTQSGETICELILQQEQEDDVIDFLDLLIDAHTKEKIQIDPNQFDKNKHLKMHRQELVNEMLEISPAFTHLPPEHILSDQLMTDLVGKNYERNIPALHQAAQNLSVDVVERLVALSARPELIVKKDGHRKRAANFAADKSETKKYLRRLADDVSDGDTTSEESDDESEGIELMKNAVHRYKSNNLSATKLEQIESLSALGLKSVSGKTPESSIMIPHFRGINFLIGSKNSGTNFLIDFRDKGILRQQYKNKSLAQEGIYSRQVLAMSGVDFLQEISNENLVILDKNRKLVQDFWRDILSKKIEIACPEKTRMKKRQFESPAHFIQQRASNTASVKDKADNTQVDIWKQIWLHIRTYKKKLLVTDFEKEKYKVFFDKNTPKESIFVCTGKTPQKAICYGLGDSYSKLTRSVRADSRTRPDGKSKYPQLGVVYIIMQCLSKYRGDTTSDVLNLSTARKINLNPRYLCETEVAFVGGIDADDSIVEFPILYPSFHLNWKKEHEEMFGLTKEQYEYFQKSYTNCYRPQQLVTRDLFNTSWNNEYIKIYGIAKEVFTAHKELFLAIKKEGCRTSELLNQYSAAFTKQELKACRSLSIENLEKNLNSPQHLKMTSNYRRYKKEIRSHLEVFYSQQMINVCNDAAITKGKLLGFIDRDGVIRCYGTKPQEVKTHLSSTRRAPTQAETTNNTVTSLVTNVWKKDNSRLSTHTPTLLQDLRIGSAPADGDCLFHSIAQLMGSNYNARNLRQRALDYMRENPAQFLTHFPGGEAELNVRITTMEGTFNHADDTEISALAFALQRQIVIISNKNPMPPIGDNAHPILFLHHEFINMNGSQVGHYQPITLKAGAQIDIIMQRLYSSTKRNHLV
ncbi:MAG: ankyrin repeat domain-containing protein [Legionellales bacterium]|jgi:ankyrin repeat protein